MSESKFYNQAASYWANVQPTIDGILCGFSHISDIDIKGSQLFLQDLFSRSNPPGRKLALDCGAGIGRVSKSVLMPYFDKVDLAEQDGKFIDTAIDFIGKNNKKLGSLYNIGLQNFKPEKKYDIIWCQWVLGHLKDYDLVSFFERCQMALNTNGVIVVKENFATGEESEYDDEDSSVTRPLALMRQIFDAAKLRVLKTELQKDFPDDIYPVHSFALVPMPEV